MCHYLQDDTRSVINFTNIISSFVLSVPGTKILRIDRYLVFLCHLLVYLFMYLSVETYHYSRYSLYVAVLSLTGPSPDRPFRRDPFSVNSNLGSSSSSVGICPDPVS